MTILLVNQYFPPDTSATAAVFAEIADALVRAGNDVTVLCGHPSYDPMERTRWQPRQRKRRNGVEIVRVGSTGFDRRNAAGRAANYVSYLCLAVILGVIRRRPDVVIAGSDPPLAVLSALLIARGRPVVYSLRDLHPDTALETGMVRSGPSTRAWSWVHTAAMRRCRLVICLGETMATRVRERGVPAEGVVVVPDGAAAPAGAPDPVVVAELRAGTDFLAVHAGNLGAAGPWEQLAQTADRVGHDAFLFVGDGVRAEVLRDRGLRVVPFRPRAELASVMAAGDVQVVALRPGLAGFVVPSKLFTALAYGRPVLAVVPAESEAAHLVAEWGCGVVADPEDPGNIAAHLAELRRDPGRRATMADRAAAAGKAFARERLLLRFVELVEAAARPSGQVAGPTG
ncbi:MAG: glycosyltransferase family 4 protein [Acidimicrobiia bacterium]